MLHGVVFWKSPRRTESVSLIRAASDLNQQHELRMTSLLSAPKKIPMDSSRVGTATRSML
jgi:hypothetical protein